MPNIELYTQQIFDATLHTPLFNKRLLELSKLTDNEHREGAFGISYRNVVEGIMVSQVLRGEAGNGWRQPGNRVTTTPLLNDGNAWRPGLAMVIHSHPLRPDRDYRLVSLPSAKDLAIYRKHCEAGHGYLIHGVLSFHPRLGGLAMTCYRENSRRRLIGRHIDVNDCQTYTDRLNSMQKANLNVITLLFNPRNGLLRNGKKDTPRLFL